MKQVYERFEFTVPFHKEKSACEVKLVKVDQMRLIFVKDINEGMSICNAFEYLFPQVLAHFNLSPDSHIRWIEFWERLELIDEEDEYSLVHYQLSNGKAHSPYWRYLSNSKQAAISALSNL